MPAGSLEVTKSLINDLANALARASITGCGSRPIRQTARAWSAGLHQPHPVGGEPCALWTAHVRAWHEKGIEIERGGAAAVRLPWVARKNTPPGAGLGWQWGSRLAGMGGGQDKQEPCAGRGNCAQTPSSWRPTLECSPAAAHGARTVGRPLSPTGSPVRQAAVHHGASLAWWSRAHYLV